MYMNLQKKLQCHCHSYGCKISYHATLCSIYQNQLLAGLYLYMYGWIWPQHSSDFLWVLHMQGAECSSPAPLHFPHTGTVGALHGNWIPDSSAFWPAYTASMGTTGFSYMPLLNEENDNREIRAGMLSSSYEVYTHTKLWWSEGEWDL